MASKNKRAGGKFTNNHTSLTPTGAVVADIANSCECVTKISPGFITAGLRSANGRRRIKIVERDSGLFVSVRGNTSHQEIQIFANDILAAKEYLVKEGGREGFIIRS